MEREVVKIDEELCNGCGICVPGCHEGALQIIDGKARLISDLMCDGLGACLGHCPQHAISIEKREAEAYNEGKVMENIAMQDVINEVHAHGSHVAGNGGGCPGSRSREIDRGDAAVAIAMEPGSMQSELRQWPVQLHLINPQAPYYRNADVLIAADCTAFAMGDFHRNYLKGKSLAIACPKLDTNTDVYLNKITAMIDHASVNTIAVMIMTVPCCGGLLQIVKQAVSAAQRKVPVKMLVVSIEGAVVKEEWV
jgi:NAD-dependent dihydropyrimidine dehydrogenase PreA subunit